MAINVLKTNAAFRVGRLSGDPANPENGIIYYNTTLNTFRIYKDGSWEDLADTASIEDLLTGTIADGDTTHAPTADAVFDALADKLSLTGGTVNNGTGSEISILDGSNIVELAGAGAFASVVNAGLTYTATSLGTDGNSYVLDIVGGGSSGTAVVTAFDGTSMTVEVEAGVTTAQTLADAVNDVLEIETNFGFTPVWVAVVDSALTVQTAITLNFSGGQNPAKLILASGTYFDFISPNGYITFDSSGFNTNLPVNVPTPLNSANATTKTYVDDKVVDGITNGVTTSAPSQNAVFDALALKQSTSEKGAANGYASLDSNGKVPVQQLPNSIMEYQGVYDVNANTPPLEDGVANDDEDIGNVYRITSGGSRDFGSGQIVLEVGDYLILNSSKIWEKSNTSDIDVSLQAAIDANGTVILEDGSASSVSITNQDLTNNFVTLDVSAISSVTNHVVSFLSNHLSYAPLKLRNSVADGTTLLLAGSSSGEIAIIAPDGISSYSLTLPDAQSSAGQVLQNDGLGNLTWETPVVLADTDELDEGATNLYFTEARAKAAAVADNITDGITDVAPSQNAVYDALELKLNVTADTDDIDEGATNLYFTDARAKAAAVADNITDGITDVAPSQNAVYDALELKQNTAQKGAANGYASLDGGGKVPVGQLPSAVMTYEGVWNASTNSPALIDGTGDAGMVYRVGTAGSQDLGSGSISFDVGDYAIYNGTIWEKSDTTDAVASVNGLTGVVVLDTDDVDEGATNLYFTDTRAQTATISQVITNGVTTKAPSEDAVFDALALKQDLITATLTLTASSTAVATALTFDATVYEGSLISYKIKEATTNRVRVGTLMVATNGTDVSVTDLFTETGDAGVTWTAAMNGDDVELSYTTTANNKNMKVDITRFTA